MVQDSIFMTMGIDIMDNFKKIKCMERVHFINLMEAIFKVSFTKTKKTARDYITKQN